MNWKVKAAIQNLMGQLPPGLANPVYYRLQRRFGGLRQTQPVSRLEAGIEIVRRLRQFGHSPEYEVFLEVGTGHQLNLPLSLWLCGADEIVTVDLNRCLKERLVMDDIDWLRRHKAEVRDLFAGIAPPDLFEERFEQLTTGSGNFRDMLSLTRIRYWAPADAGTLVLKSNSVDYHISFTVLEHVSTTVLKRIFREGRRLLKPDGLFIHCIDFSDHFAHSDGTVSPVNFLQFSEGEWNRLAGNRYMFHNRLRVDEFRDLLQELDLEVLALDTQVDEAAAAVLRNGFQLNERFRNKDSRTNATAQAWLVASPGRAA